MSTPAQSATPYEASDAIREQIGSYVGRIAFEPSVPITYLHTSRSSKWRGAALVHARTNGDTSVEGAWSTLRVVQRVSEPGRAFTICTGERAPPPDATLRVGIPGAVYRGTVTDTYEVVTLYVDLALVERTLHAPYSEALIAAVASRLHQDRVIEQLMGALLSDVVEGSPGGPLLGETVVAAVIHRLHAAGDASSMAQGARLSAPELRLLRDYVAANLAGPLHLEDLAVLLGTSVRRFCRGFRNATGLSPHQYVLGCRVERARDLLRRPGLSLDEVAEACGFAGRTHMSSCFRKLLGPTPSQIRAHSREPAPLRTIVSGF